ncbi:MAG: cytosine permease [Candidatus Aerophobetes bacterium]|nr:cytosine permease [Candidatus Aerophobetes bacterium]
MSEKEIWPWEDKFGDYSMVPVPTHERRSFLSIFYVYMGVLACIAVLWGGGTLGLQFTLKEVVVVAIVGSAILAVIGGLTAAIGGISKCSTYINMRYPFGRIGSQLFGTIIAGVACGIGWFAVQTWLFGIILNTLFPNAWWANVGVASIWGGLLMITTAIIGFKGLAWLSYLAVPFFMLLAGVGAMIGIANAGGFAGLASIKPANPVSFGIGVTEVVGMYIAGGVITADISRYAKKVLDGPIAWIVQVIIFQVYMLSGAAALTLATGAANVAQALLIGGAGLGAILMAVLGQWTTNDNNLYNGALSFNTWIPIKKKYITLGEGLIGVGLAAWFGFYAGASMQPFQNFLTLLGKILPAIGGVLAADFYLYRWYKKEPLRQRYHFKPGMKIAQVNWAGWVSVLLAAIIGGWVMKSGIPALNVMILGAVFYIVIAIVCSGLGVKIDIGEHTIGKTGV